jgi:hypothetical protein
VRFIYIFFLKKKLSDTVLRIDFKNCTYKNHSRKIENSTDLMQTSCFIRYLILMCHYFILNAAKCKQKDVDKSDKCCITFDSNNQGLYTKVSIFSFWLIKMTSHLNIFSSFNSEKMLAYVTFKAI